MREYGFLVPEKITARYVIESKRKKIGKLVSIEPTTTVRKALDLMRENDISQVPVLDHGKPVGGVTDHEIMTSVMEHPALVDSPISTLMGPGFPLVNIDVLIEDVIKELKSKKNPAVLIEEGQKIVGILSRYDLIEFMGK
jgi:cystathionine beta-synthase